MASDAAKRVSALLFRGMDKMRHRGAFEVGAVVPKGKDFTGFGKTRQILLVTFKRSGEGMPTPINYGVADGKIYVRKDASTGKVKRPRNNPRRGGAKHFPQKTQRARGSRACPGPAESYRRPISRSHQHPSRDHANMQRGRYLEACIELAGPGFSGEPVNLSGFAISQMAQTFPLRAVIATMRGSISRYRSPPGLPAV